MILGVYKRILFIPNVVISAIAIYQRNDLNVLIHQICPWMKTHLFLEASIM